MIAYPPHRILVPVDFGPASARAARVAATIAGRVGASLTALHAEAIEAPPYFTPEQIGRLERERAEARSAAERYVAEFLADAGGRFDVQIGEAPAGDAILHAAGAADLIVMGTHGRRGPRRWWLGSVAEQVVLHSTVPVLVVRDAPNGEPGALFSRVVVSQAAAVGSRLPVAHGYAAGLAGTFNGSVMEIEGDAGRRAKEAGGTLLVVSRIGVADESWFDTIAGHLLRECGMPMLFVTE